MTGLVVAAPQSGSGKTSFTCALLAALKRRGFDPCSFKCGPDYIDPMFHRSVLGVDCRNLDLFLASENRVQELFAAGACGHEAAVVEGAMGLYDGLSFTDRASAWHVSQALGLPIVLVLRPRGASLTLAAQLKGLLEFRSPCPIAGIVLNDCREGLYRSLAPMLERETGLPVLGFLPHMEEAQLPSRHLGLYTAGEIKDLNHRIEALSQALEEHVDLDRLVELCSIPVPPHGPFFLSADRKIPIAVARDEAFCFTYAETLEALERADGVPVFFSPIHDSGLPTGIGGLYLPGGYPELHAQALSKNEAMRAAVRTAVEGGLPTVAECGGFLYLGRELTDAEGVTYPMTGVLPGSGFPTGKLVRFGYAHLTAQEDSLLFRAGESIPVHEFHHWDSTENGSTFHAEKPGTGRSWDCGFASQTLYAAFPHLYFGGDKKLAERFISAASTYLS